MYLDSGALIWNINSTDNCFWYEKPDLAPVTDFDVSIDVLNYSPNGTATGIVFRRLASGDQYYFSVYNSARKYAFFLYRFQKWTVLIDWTYSASIRSEEVNRLRVVAKGSHFTFYVNGNEITSSTDSTLSSGFVGLAAELYNSGNTFSAKYDNFELHADEK